MTPLTRREFLQFSGILLAGSQWLSAFDHVDSLTTAATAQGRTLAPVAVTRADGSVAATLLPDSLLRIERMVGDRFGIPGGFAPRALIQPLTVFPSDEPLPALPFLAEVCAPVAPVRASCAADAPLLARIGHAGTARVRSRLADGRGGADWYEVETAGLTGWSQSTHWTPARIVEPPSRSARSLVVDRATQTLSAFDGNTLTLQALVSVDPAVQAGDFAVGGRNASGLDLTRYGAPWQLTLDSGAILGGATWHNRFGEAVEGMPVQLAPAVARQLYAWLPDGAAVSVR